MEFPAEPTIETSRLTIRLVTQADLPALLEYNSDEAVTRYLPYGNWNGIDDAQEWLGRATTRLAAGEALQFVAVLRETGHVVGSCLLFHFDESSRRAEVGYLLGRKHWGAGYMFEAMKALVDFAFAQMNLRRLEAEIDPRNTSSAELLERLGFVQEGLLRQRWDLKGEVSDSGLYGLLRADWNRRTQPQP
ncbi:N-acetyltransferase [Ramlibacter sp. WS9]|nr:N-acetyltransferase [Ramlibacter sp. WS9]